MREENLEKLKQIFIVVLDLSDGVDPSDVVRETNKAWDSLAHMSLVAAMESEFSVSIDASEAEKITFFSAAEAMIGEKGL